MKITKFSILWHHLQSENFYWKVGFYALVMAGTAHALFILLFALLGVPVMALVNIASTAAYWFSIFVLGMEAMETRDDRLIGWIVYIELIGHNVLATYYLGRGAGFQYYVYIPAFVPFFIFSYSRAVYGVRIASVLVIAMLMDTLDLFDLVRVDIDPSWIAWIHHVNLLIFLVTMSLLAHLYSVHAKAHHEYLEDGVYRDPLTGLYNRRYMHMQIQKAFAADAPRRVSGLILIDIDRFKHLNDTHGHDCGDMAIVHVSRLLADSASDGTVARWGGEEFLVCLPEADEEMVRHVGERIRSRIDHLVVECNDRPIRLTVTLGGTIMQCGDTFEQMIRRADEALYEGKRLGRNRMVVR